MAAQPSLITDTVSVNGSAMVTKIMTKSLCDEIGIFFTKFGHNCCVIVVKYSGLKSGAVAMDMGLQSVLLIKQIG